jgi:2-oxoglutarate dehydrogenase E2 component (dihydrolipoamide succinyltransferase)
MAIEIKAPVVGESITEVTIAKWLKSEGDFVEMDEVICEMESEKATFELNAETSGILTIKVKEGDTVQVGDVICVIEDSDKVEVNKKDKPEEKEDKIEHRKPKSPQKTGEIIEMKVPTVGESITEVTISAWNKKDGENVELDDVIAEIESEKATFELTAEGRGILHHKAEEGATLEIGGLICTIEVTSGIPVEKEQGKTDIVQTEEHKSIGDPYSKGHPSPAAAKIMSEKGIRSEDIIGSGPGGRILKEDAMKAIPLKKEEKKLSTSDETIIPPSHTQSLARTETRQKLSQLRKTVSRRLVAVKNETAMLTTFNEVNMAAIMDLRKKYKETFKEKYEVNLGFMSFFTKACCIALHEWPSVNAKIDGDEIIFHDFCDISIAVSAPKGLVVPVIRNAESLSFVEIERVVLTLATKARENKLSIEEMTGGTFTITNGGVFGSMMSTPIINAPQSAILGMHNIVERPVVENGEIVIRPIMYLALSYDHRIIDGRESVSFLVRIKELLEDPSRLLLEI